MKGYKYIRLKYILLLSSLIPLLALLSCSGDRLIPSPSGLKSSYVFENRLTLEWNYPDDKYHVEGYEVYLDGELRQIASNNVCQFNALEPETSYEFYVVAFGENGNRSSQSETLKVNTVPFELYRPQFHFTPHKNWMNDPNGLVYYKGEYHLYFQHNPAAREEELATHNNTHWGHAVSTDLINWRQLDNVLAPDEMGLMFSGSAVVDWNNTSGFQTAEEPPILAFYTASSDEDQIQCLAYSNDRGRTMTKYEGNPVVVNEYGGEQRDPKVFWYEPDSKWVMAIYEHGGFGFYESKDAKNWVRLSGYGHGKGFEDCADLFPLPLDGDISNTKWILHDGATQYYIGNFDGINFTAETPIINRINYGSYAYQTWNDIPASDGRTLQTSWIYGPDWPEMPFNQQMTFPCELKLKSFPEGMRVCRTPAREIEWIREEINTWRDENIVPSDNLLESVEGMLFDINAEFEIGTGSEFGFEIRGEKTVSYNTIEGTVKFGSADDSEIVKMAPVDNRISIRILVDRSSVEAYVDDGRRAFANYFFPEEDNKSLELFSTDGITRLISMDIYELQPAH
jgi:sucrose-6-phosphate hydrolase SacC (GH32 family)